MDLQELLQIVKAPHLTSSTCIWQNGNQVKELTWTFSGECEIMTGKIVVDYRVQQLSFLFRQCFYFLKRLLFQTALFTCTRSCLHRKLRLALGCTQMKCFWGRDREHFWAAPTKLQGCTSFARLRGCGVAQISNTRKVALDNGQHVGAVLMDLSKAFDAIPNGIWYFKRCL